MKAGISVVICTYNGKALLPKTLLHLALQQVSPEIEWEVIVVNNASTDDTSEVVLSEWKQLGSLVPLSLLHQPLLGLSNAREMGFKNAKYEFILFCDDDNWLAPDYINLAYELMLKYPFIGVLGGHGEITFENPPPQWVFGLGVYAHGPQAKASGKVKENKVYGAGCVIRKTAYNKIASAGFKSMLSDRKGTKLSAGGDYELCYAIALAGYEIWFDDRLRFKHFMPGFRLTTDYYIRTVREGVQGLEVLIPYRIKLELKSRNILLYNWKLARLLFTYTKKLTAILLEDLRLKVEAEEAELNALRLISLKSKLRCFKRYKVMRENFLKVWAFEQAVLETVESEERSPVLSSVSSWADGLNV